MIRYHWRLERDGEVREGEMEFPNDNLVWYWTDGNYGCNCNRADLFGDPQMDCGEGRYRARVTVDGEVVLEEKDGD